MDSVTQAYVQERYESRSSRKQFMQVLYFMDDFYTHGDINHTNVKQIKRDADTVETMHLLSHDFAQPKSHFWDEDFSRIHQVPDPRMPMESLYNCFSNHLAKLEYSRGNKERRDYDFRNREGKDDWTEQPWKAYMARNDYTKESDRLPPNVLRNGYQMEPRERSYQ